MVSADKQQEKRRRKKNEISLKCLAAEEHNESCCNVDENEILKRRVFPCASTSSVHKESIIIATIIAEAEERRKGARRKYPVSLCKCATSHPLRRPRILTLP